MIQNKIMNDSGKIITLKDLSNIRTTARKHDSNNNLVEVIKTKHNCSVEVSTDEANNFNGIFIQDQFMAESFHTFPEVPNILLQFKNLFITTKLYNIHYILRIFQ